MAWNRADRAHPPADESALAWAIVAMSDAVATLARNAGAGLNPAVPRNPKDPGTWGKVGRNEVCPCGSGKKFKHCHGRFG